MSAPAAPKLTLEHQLIANALAFLVVQFPENENWPVVLACLGDAHRAAERSGPQAIALIDAATLVLKFAPARRTADGAASWAHAIGIAQIALSSFFFWRFALVQDALHPQPEETVE
ncbi:MAG: hypothetical protein V4712_15165 [Pseudomonadota bacterium]